MISIVWFQDIGLWRDGSFKYFQMFLTFQIDCAMHMLLNLMSEKQKKYHKYAEQFQRVSETVTTLNKIKSSIDSIVPKMESLNQLLPPDDRLEPFDMKTTGTSSKWNLSIIVVNSVVDGWINMSITWLNEYDV